MFSACTVFACYVARMWPNSFHTLMTQPSSNAWCFPGLAGGSASSNVGQVLPPSCLEWAGIRVRNTAHRLGGGKRKTNSGLFHSPKLLSLVAFPQAQPRTYKLEVRKNLLSGSNLEGSRQSGYVLLWEKAVDTHLGVMWRSLSYFQTIDLWFMGHSFCWGGGKSDC